MFITVQEQSLITFEKFLEKRTVWFPFLVSREEEVLEKKVLFKLFFFFSIKAWAMFKGKYKEGIDKPDPPTWKTRLRCALNKSNDFDEIVERSQLDISDPYKVYRIIPEGAKKGEYRNLPCHRKCSINWRTTGLEDRALEMKCTMHWIKSLQCKGYDFSATAERCCVFTHFVCHIHLLCCCWVGSGRKHKGSQSMNQKALVLFLEGFGY